MITLCAADSVEKRYQAWINNKVQALSLTIHRASSADAASLLKHEFFLEEIEHHFICSGSGCRVWRAFDYLKRYLRSCAEVKSEHQRGALKMLGFIYAELGFDGQKIS